MSSIIFISTDGEDFGSKVSRARKLLREGTKVILKFEFHGREIERVALGFEMIKQVLVELAGIGRPVAEPRLVGRHVTVGVASWRSGNIKPNQSRQPTAPSGRG
jgi:translation initiation factor IF-3